MGAAANKRVFVSTVGTSILGHLCHGDKKKQLSGLANALKEDYEADDLELVTSLKKEALDKISESDANWQSYSAEINTLLRLEPNYENDFFIFILTDTYQSEVVGDILKEYLNSKGARSIVLHQVKGLNTKSKESFDASMKLLIASFEDEGELHLKQWKAQGYDVIFNLTGGFKTLQGVLNIVGMFYADHIYYIFERSSEVLSIPKLPIKIDNEVFKNHITEFMYLVDADEMLTIKEVENIDSIFIDQDDSSAMISTWGQLSWNNAKDEYFKDLNNIKLPYIVFEDSFKKDFQKFAVDANRRRELMGALALVSYKLKQSNGDLAALKANNAQSLKYDQYTGKHKQYGHFRLKAGGRRVSAEKLNGKLHLRKYGEHDYVNENP